MLIKFLIAQTKEYYRLKKINAQIEYPTWLYHRFYEPQIVYSRAEHESIGESWQKAPFAETKKQIAKTEQSQTSESEIIGSES
jgi:hypothetical protein